MIFISGIDQDNAPIHSNASLKYIQKNSTTKNRFTSILYPTSYREMDCLNPSVESSIINQLNTGAGLLYYQPRSHSSSWDNPFISYDDINTLTENSFAGFWIANCCYTRN